MKKLLLLALVCLSACGLPNHIHEKFDIANYNKNQVNGVAHRTMSHQVLVEQSKLPDGSYLEKWSSLKPTQIAFSTHKEFYSTGEVKFIALTCYGFYVSKGKVYDKTGNVIKEINFDEPYKFSISKLDMKIRQEFGDKIFYEDVQLSRTDNTNPPVYKLALPIPGNKKIKQYVVVDANTGATISNVTGPVQ